MEWLAPLEINLFTNMTTTRTGNNKKQSVKWGQIKGSPQMASRGFKFLSPIVTLIST